MYLIYKDPTSYVATVTYQIYFYY